MHRPEVAQSQQRRSGRTKPRVVYEEPKLGSKLRQVKLKIVAFPVLPDVNERHDCCSVTL